MKNILVAVSGLTPQVISETLYCLSVQKKIKIDEIYVITTTEGKKNTEEYYFMNRKTNKKEGPYSLKEEIEKMCGQHKINVPVFSTKGNVIVASEENIKMHDVRTDKDNILFPNVITKILKKLTSDDRSILYCSLSGGRKTMSAYMGFALSIYAREGDKLFHVLASDDFEKTGRFYPEKKNNKDLILSEVPFIKLRPVLNDKVDYKNKSYTEIIEQSQKELERLNEKGITIDIKKRTLNYKGNAVKFEPAHLALYLFFVFLKRTESHSFNIQGFTKKDKTDENLNVEKVYKLYLQLCSKTQTEYEGMLSTKEKDLKWFRAGIDFKMFRSYRSKINDKIEELFGEEDWLADNFVINKSGPHGTSEYAVYAPLDKFLIV